MNQNSKTFLLVIVIILALVFTGLLFSYLRNSQRSNLTDTPATEESQTVDNDSGPLKGELNFQEPQTKIEIGTEGLTKGTFEKVEGENIFIRTSDDSITRLALTIDEIAVTCTTQDLSSATELDFNQVVKVEVTTPSGLTAFIPANETVVVIAQNVDTVNRVHTVALDANKCNP